LPRISDVAVADLLQVIRARLLRYLLRRHVVEDDGEGQTRFLADDLAEREPALAQLAAAAVSGLPPAGPELRRKPLTVVLPPADGPKVVRPLCVEDGGFSLHAATRVGAEDDVGRTNLLKYVLRPPTQLTIPVPRTVPLAISWRLSTTRIERSSGHTVDDRGSVFVDLDTHDKRPNEQSPLIPIEVLEAGAHLLGEVG
jgi:hypothetical protein